MDPGLAQAEEISQRRLRWEAGRLRVPTRLREIGNVLDMAGAEGTVAPGLRLGRLRQILMELDLLDVHDDVHVLGAAVPPW